MYVTMLLYFKFTVNFPKLTSSLYLSFNLRCIHLEHCEHTYINGPQELLIFTIMYTYKAIPFSLKCPWASTSL